jgi:hypothetical protein
MSPAIWIIRRFIIAPRFAEQFVLAGNRDIAEHAHLMLHPTRLAVDGRILPTVVCMKFALHAVRHLSQAITTHGSAQAVEIS